MYVYASDSDRALAPALRRPRWSGYGPRMADHDGERRSDAPVLSPVIRSLRLTGDEVQLGRVLAAFCQDSAVARAFTVAVIAKARDGNTATRRRIRTPPGEIR